ncbi:Disease resistance protein RGA2 [Rhynchospora pubera]|uniref:Disease resistance protein RGA2 n=1 Tax=Rhynchospora pubera TaxID=906938 RepID=A0AAV8GQM9_9POAL|nr:Disease resistance protein RGA2 [Rhynchospora pubera]
MEIKFFVCEIRLSSQPFSKRIINKEVKRSMGVATSTASMLYSGGVEATAGMIVSGGVSSLTSTFGNQEELDVALYSIKNQLSTIKCVINATRVLRQITNEELLEKRSLLIKAYHFGNYYYRTIKHRHSLPSLVEFEGTENLVIPAAKRRRTIRTFFFGDEDLKELYYVLKMLENIDVQTFYSMVNAQPERPIKTYLYMDHNRLFNRDKERQQVMNFLFEPSKTGEDNVAILPIVGSQEVGKTSLALHCFEDSKVKNHFLKRIDISAHRIVYGKDWFDSPTRIYIEILRKLNSSWRPNYGDDENELIAMLKQELSCERFLLLMDDVWSVESVVWNSLWNCLRCGKQGSKVLLIGSTWHYKTYEKIVSPQAVMPVMLDGFPEDEYLTFFNEHAFGGANPDEYPKLAKMGREIANKMDGSIWGAKILGELLRDYLNAEFWSYFLKDGVLSSLAASKNIFSVINTMCKLVPKSNLEVFILKLSYSTHPRDEHTTFKELMLLGPDRCTPLIEKGKNFGVQFLVTEHVFLNRCTVFTAGCGPPKLREAFHEARA